MGAGHSETALRDVDRLFAEGTVAGLDDAELLERFVARRDEVAFAALVSRHGPMVLGVCRGVLKDHGDAEDAFQATFLVLVRKARSLRVERTLAGWLCRVSSRIAVQVDADARRRSRREKRVAELRASRLGGASEDNLSSLLCEEIDRLPEKYRVPVVLCGLEGMTHAEAARQLGCPIGTVSGRLSRARELLRARLTRRGVTVPAGLLAAGMSSPSATAAAPTALVASTVEATVRAAARGATSSSVARLAEASIRSMLMTKIKAAAVILLAAGAMAVGLGAIARHVDGAAPTVPAGHEPSAVDRPNAATGPAPQSKPPRGVSELVQAAEGGPANEAREFELRVVGPGGRPLPKAEVEFATDPVPTAEQVRRGTFVKQGRLRAIVATDAEGRIVIALPRQSDRFNAFITVPGYGPYWAGWTSESHAESVPATLTAELEPAWSVGGIVVDGEGKAVEGAVIRPSIEFKKRPGETQQMGVGVRLKTDADGKWHFDSVPTSMGQVHVAVDHPMYMPARRFLTRAGYGIERGREPTAKIILERGLTVSGKVTDETGRPIAGALVRTKYSNELREAKTGPDGVYHLVGCEPRAVRIVASAEGRAMDMKELTIDPDLGPVDFRLEPGGTVRIRVLDERGKPVPKARIFFQRWRGPISYFEFAHVNQYADDEGVWVWHEAPLDEFKADICPPGGMQLPEQPLIARREEYVFRTTGPLVISGKVVDAVTKEPIKQFRVVPGIRSSGTHMNWVPREAFTATDGRYRVRQTRGYLAHMIRIEADGYRSAVSRDIGSTEGDVSIDFELARAQDVAAKVVGPGLFPAAGAKVALGIAGSQISIMNGEIDERSTFATRTEADASGLFHLPAQDKDFHLIITHPSGFAHVTSTPEWELTRIIRLEPWAKVDGTFRVGRSPAANVPVTIDVGRPHSYGEGVPGIFTRYRSSTGPEGRFAFDRVIPGKGRIGREITMLANEGATEATSSCMIAAEFVAGETTHLELGGTGRAVVGTLRPAAGFDGRVRWNFALVTAVPEGDEARATGPRLTATVGRDGSFRIDDVPAGGYSLSVWFRRDQAGRLHNHRFKVSPAEDEFAGQPVDLGVLMLDAP
jgi:RNA polymerase sigma factor (sigma-70 family)